VKFGYLVPEFPGQTHTFFWRELAALRALGMNPDVVSTRRPNARIMSQGWAQEAKKATTYLAPLTIRSATGAARILVGAARAGRWTGIMGELTREAKGISDSMGWRAAAKGMARNMALLLAGAELSHLAALRGWTHLHVHSCADSAQVALFAHQLTGLTYSLTLHGSLGDYGPNQPAKWQHTKFSTVITDRLLQEVTSTLGMETAARASVVPMGVDSAKFSRQAPYTPWDRNGPARIFSCGRLNGSKGHDDLVRAVGQLTAEGLDIELVIAGEDEQGGTGYRRYLEGLLCELGLTDRITLLGAVAEEQVRSQLEISHVFALASHAEPLGVAIMEAMSMELPVVVTSGGGVAELVENECSGILVPAGVPSDLAREIREVLLHPDLAKNLGHTAREKVITSFTSQRGAVALARLIREATAGSAHGQEAMR
jgi:colanic acid/amylovoran biosynthesis glycosyltransferase